MVTYDRRFALWWGLMLFVCKLGSRRQLDFQFRDLELAVLENLNRFSDCQQESLPVNKTLSHFLGHVGSAAIADLRPECVRRLILFFQMFEKGSLLQQLAREYASTPLQLFGSLKNLAQRLLECFRYFRLPDQDWDPRRAAPCQIRICDSS